MTVRRLIKRRVQYEKSLVTYIDILGFGELIATKKAGEISRIIRVVKEAVEPRRFKTEFKEIPSEEYINFSDLSIISIPVRKTSLLPPRGALYLQIMRMVHAQAILLAEEGIVIRGGITVGDIVKSYGQLFGPAIIRAYELESKVADNPRIVVGKEVFKELAVNPGLWVHDRQSEQQGVRELLREDDDGEFFIDYLRVMSDEFDDPDNDYKNFLEHHKSLIVERLQRYSDAPKIRSKYEWMERYHSYTASVLKTQ